MGPPKSGRQITAALTSSALRYCSVHPWASRRFQAPLTSFIKCASMQPPNPHIFHPAFATLPLVHSIACDSHCKRHPAHSCGAMRWHSNLASSSQSPGRKFRQLVVRHGVTDLNGVAAHFAIFHVSLLVHG